MEIDAKRFLAAMEADGGVEIAETAPNPVDAPTEGIGDPVMTEAERSAILMMMIREEMGGPAFTQFIQDSAVELEVFKIIPNAEMMQNSAAGASEVKSAAMSGVTMCCITMANNANHAAARAFAAADEAKKRAMADMVECYTDAAKQEVLSILSDAKAKAMPMNNHTGEMLCGLIDRIVAKLTEA